MRSETFQAWPPTKQRLINYLVYRSLADILFLFVYLMCNYLAAARADWYRLYFDWELNLPFIPQFILIYVSILILLWLPLFTLSSREFQILSYRIAVAIIISGIIFLLFPAHIGFQRPELISDYSWMYYYLEIVDQPHNLLPSLHISYSALILYAAFMHASPALKLFYLCWFFSMCFAVVLIYQHHVLDVLGGVVVFLLCQNIFKGDKAG